MDETHEDVQDNVRIAGTTQDCRVTRLLFKSFRKLVVFFFFFNSFKSKVANRNYKHKSNIQIELIEFRLPESVVYYSW